MSTMVKNDYSWELSTPSSSSSEDVVLVGIMHDKSTGNGSKSERRS